MTALCTERIKICDWYTHALKEIDGASFDMKNQEDGTFWTACNHINRSYLRYNKLQHAVMKDLCITDKRLEKSMDQ